MPQAPAPSLSEHMDGQRDRLSKDMSIIACCRLACASLLDQSGNLEVMYPKGGRILAVRPHLIGLRGNLHELLALVGSVKKSG